jgi:hypothetical protein
MFALARRLLAMQEHSRATVCLFAIPYRDGVCARSVRESVVWAIAPLALLSVVNSQARHTSEQPAVKSKLSSIFSRELYFDSAFCCPLFDTAWHGYTFRSLCGLLGHRVELAGAEFCDRGCHHCVWVGRRCIAELAGHFTIWRANFGRWFQPELCSAIPTFLFVVGFCAITYDD